MRALLLIALGACSASQYPRLVIQASGQPVAVEPPESVRASCAVEPPTLGLEPIDGCLARGDAVDTFTLEAPGNYRIEVAPRTHTINTELSNGGEVVDRAVVGRGRVWTRRARLESGARYKIRLEHHSSAFVRYQIRAIPIDALLERRPAKGAPPREVIGIAGKARRRSQGGPLASRRNAASGFEN